jgi:uncharacterized protein (TIGR03083 family)
MADKRAQVRAAIIAAHEQLAATLDGFGADDWQRPSANEGWTVKDTVAHLATIEERIRLMVRSAVDGTPAAVEDIHSYNARKVGERRAASVAQLRAELAQERAASLALLDSLAAADLDRPYDHPTRGRVTVEQLWYIIPRHIEAHLRDIVAEQPRAHP